TLAVSPDGSLIADLVTVDDDGAGHEGIGVWMLDGAGLDPVPGFGDGLGRAFFTLPSGAKGADLAVTNSAKVTSGGNPLPAAGGALAGRLRGDGTPDPSFDGDGKKLIPIPVFGSMQSLGIDAQERITLIGTTAGGIAVARVRSDGKTATGFGGT